MTWDTCCKDKFQHTRAGKHATACNVLDTSWTGAKKTHDFRLWVSVSSPLVGAEAAAGFRSGAASSGEPLGLIFPPMCAAATGPGADADAAAPPIGSTVVTDSGLPPPALVVVLSAAAVKCLHRSFAVRNHHRQGLCDDYDTEFD